MTHDELVNLIRAGVRSTGGTWADFGAGDGNFTRALRELVGDAATLYALDKDRHALNGQPRDVKTVVADFTQALPALPLFDGLLVANALHFVRWNQAEAFARIAKTLTAGGTFLIVEYETSSGHPVWVPNPIPFAKFSHMAAQLGWTEIEQVGVRESPRDGHKMYAARAVVG
ncbi:MAG: class I SAM-dependent methyltransferase [Phototrophicaceae bacterium]|jgi:ubiquinone/menaquinone biosynthesis C-methylase UbiE